VAIEVELEVTDPPVVVRLGDWPGKLVEVVVLRLGLPRLRPTDWGVPMMKFAPNQTDMTATTATTATAVRSAPFLSTIKGPLLLCENLSTLRFKD